MWQSDDAKSVSRTRSSQFCRARSPWDLPVFYNMPIYVDMNPQNVANAVTAAGAGDARVAGGGWADAGCAGGGRSRALAACAIDATQGLRHPAFERSPETAETAESQKLVATHPSAVLPMQVELTSFGEHEAH